MVLGHVMKPGFTRCRGIMKGTLRKAVVSLFLLLIPIMLLSFNAPPARSDSSNLLVFAEAPSFARLDEVDPSGWFYQAVLFNPTASDIVVTGLRWRCNATAKMIDNVRNAECYDSRYFSFLPTTNQPDDKTVWWEYATGSISVVVPSRKAVVTWIEVPVGCVNNDVIPTTYCVEAYVNGQWLSSPLYKSHGGHDNSASTVFRADFNLTTHPEDEQQVHPNPGWLFNEDRSVVAGLSGRVKLIPVTSSRNSGGIDYAIVNVTLPSGWSYVGGTAFNPYGESVVPYSSGNSTGLIWSLQHDVLRYSNNQSMSQNYVEFNVTGSNVAGIHNFTVASTITSLGARTTSESQYIYVVVRTAPSVNFTSTPAVLPTYGNVSFNATASRDLDGSIVNYFWDFGDGTNETGSVATHAYVENGTYVVSLTITDNDGLSASVQDMIIVLNRTPVARFTESAETVDTDVMIYFNASSSYDPDGTVTGYYWDFGDGTNSTDPTPNHSYSEDGAYIVALTVVDNDGALNSTSSVETVLDRLPTASFTKSSDMVYTWENVTFDASGSFDSDGLVVGFFWDFGDETNASEISIVDHAYADNGTYTVVLTVTDDDGSFNSSAAVIYVLNRGPVAGFTASADEAYTGETIAFNASLSYDIDGNVTGYFWNFGDNVTTADKNPFHAYAENGNYTVTLTVMDNDGTSASFNSTVTILNKSPAATFNASTSTAYTGESIFFNGTDSIDSDGNITEYFWDFGDGTNATGSTANHPYAECGNHTVQLTVTDNDGASNTTYANLIILNRSPVASFLTLPEVPKLNDTITFDATSSTDPDGTIMSYNWDFGDGNTTTTNNNTIAHLYGRFGDFNVTLTVTDNHGDNDTFSQIVSLPLHDVAIINVTLSSSETQIGQIVNITVRAKNRGTETESFHVNVLCNETIIAVRSLADLAPGAEQVLTFYWNTSNVSHAAKFLIRAVAENVTGELELADNACTGGFVNLLAPQGNDGFSQPQFDWNWALLAIPLLALSLVGIVWRKRNGAGKLKGLDYFDEITGGGIPDSFSVMITGVPGSGKSVFCQELAYSFLTKGKPCVYVTYDCFPDEVRENMRSFHPDVPDHEHEKKFTFIDCYSATAKVESKEKHALNQPFSLSDLGITLSTVTSEVGKNLRMLLDSIVPLLTHVDPQKVVEFLQDRSARIKGVNGTFIFTVGRETIEPNLISRLEEASDCVIELEVGASKGKTVRKLRVKKMRGRRTSDKWIRYEIDPSRGIVFPTQD